MMTKKILVLLAVLAAALAMVATASAAPPCAKNPTHPDCVGPLPPSTTTTTVPDEEAPAGWTCAWAERSALWWEDPNTEYDDFSFVLTPEQTGACIDVVSSEEGRWLVTFASPAESRPVRGVTIVPQDAIGPGDSCGGWGARQEEEIYGTWTMPLFTDDRFSTIPPATVNGCPGNDSALTGGSGVGDFAEWVERLDSETGELTFDYVRGPTDEVHPLALRISTSGLRKTGDALYVCIDLPPLEITLDEEARTYPDPLPCDPLAR